MIDTKFLKYLSLNSIERVDRNREKIEIKIIQLNLEQKTIEDRFKKTLNRGQNRTKNWTEFEFSKSNGI